MHTWYIITEKSATQAPSCPFPSFIAHTNKHHTHMHAYNAQHTAQQCRASTAEHRRAVKQAECTHTTLHTHTHTHTFVQWACLFCSSTTNTHTSMHTSMHTHTPPCSGPASSLHPSHTHIHAHIHAHTHMHTHTPPCSGPVSSLHPQYATPLGLLHCIQGSHHTCTHTHASTH